MRFDILGAGPQVCKLCAPNPSRSLACVHRRRRSRARRRSRRQFDLSPSWALAVARLEECRRMWRQVGFSCTLVFLLRIRQERTPPRGTRRRLGQSLQVPPNSHRLEVASL